jgi:hypothetical protein
LHEWHRVVQGKSHKVSAGSVAEYVDAQDPAIVSAIEKIIKQPLIRELGVLEVTVPWEGKQFLAATSCVLWTHADEVYLHDILIADPKHRLRKREQKSSSQRHKGFGLLSATMESLFEAARERNARVLTLAAAHRALVPVFGRYGFSVESNRMAQFAFSSGVGIPMEAHL